jgi:hypothetical protein
MIFHRLDRQDTYQCKASTSATDQENKLNKRRNERAERWGGQELKGIKRRGSKTEDDDGHRTGWE